ncbi:MAG: NAD-dependent deacylase [Proteobacteria bacterium]|nr:NAD-dependent deacylase [Pseudomonadota bacterium]
MAEASVQLAELIGQARSLVAFTGAGVSTESGIPDFRSPGGLWSRYRPVTFQEFLASHEARVSYWSRYLDMHPVFSGVQPNPGHYALAELERQGRLTAVITQNVDGLHQAAGSSEDKVIELHGRVDVTRCLDCGYTLRTNEVIERVQAGVEVPVCDRCGGWFKPATISFGQSLPAEALDRAIEVSTASDLFLAIGSSLTVHPAAALPGLALRHGARLVILNAMPTDYDQNAHLVIQGRSGSILADTIKHLGGSLTPH